MRAPQYQPVGIYRTRNPRLHFTTHESDERTLSEIERFPHIYFFSSSIPEVQPTVPPPRPALKRTNHAVTTLLVSTTP